LFPGQSAQFSTRNPGTFLQSLTFRVTGVLPPALLQHLSQDVLERGLAFRWSCRSKLELAHTPELFRLMRRAGCFEALYGLETVSPRMQRRMSKYVEGLDAGRVRSLYRATAEAGLGLHVNLIAQRSRPKPSNSRSTP
jgi:hypothetical protein